MARSLMKGSATLWIGTAVITRTSVSVLAVSAPRSISAFMIVHGEDFLGHPGQAGRVDPGAPRSGERLATEFDDDPAIARHSQETPNPGCPEWQPRPRYRMPVPGPVRFYLHHV